MIREPWIRVHAHLAEKPVTTRMAKALRVDPFKAIGHLVTFWGNMADHGKNGVVVDLEDAKVERWAGWDGKKGAFAAWLRSEHVDHEGRVNDWDEYEGALEARRLKERQRLRDRRAQQNAGRARNGTHDIDATERSTDAQQNAVRTSGRTHVTGRSTTSRSSTTSRVKAAPELAPHVGQGEEYAAESRELVNQSRARRGETPLPSLKAK